MPRFPKAPSKSISVFEQAHRFYGKAFEATSSRELSDSMAEWAELGPAERTFTMAHLLYLNLLAQAGTHLLLRKVWDAVEDLVDELEDQTGDGDDEDEEPGADDAGDAGDDLEPAQPAQPAPSAPPPGVTIHAAEPMPPVEVAIEDGDQVGDDDPDGVDDPDGHDYDEDEDLDGDDNYPDNGDEYDDEGDELDRGRDDLEEDDDA